MAIKFGSNRIRKYLEDPNPYIKMWIQMWKVEICINLDQDASTFGKPDIQIWLNFILN